MDPAGLSPSETLSGGLDEALGQVEMLTAKLAELVPDGDLDEIQESVRQRGRALEFIGKFPADRLDSSEAERVASRIRDIRAMEGRVVSRFLDRKDAVAEEIRKIRGGRRLFRMNYS